MPLLRILTNAAVETDTRELLLKRGANGMTRARNKPVEHAPVTLEPAPLRFGGTDKPAAFLEWRATHPPKDRARRLAAGLIKPVQRTLPVSSKRVFIHFLDAPPGDWGWNGGAFG